MRISQWSHCAFFLGMMATIGVASADAATIRATALTTDLINKALSGELNDLTVEFKSGDRLPVVFTAEGDLLETMAGTPSYWSVKRDFYVKLENKTILMSLDGKEFKPFKQVIKGDLTIDATADSEDPVANAINLNLKALIK